MEEEKQDEEMTDETKVKDISVTGAAYCPVHPGDVSPGGMQVC